MIPGGEWAMMNRRASALSVLVIVLSTVQVCGAIHLELRPSEPGVRVGGIARIGLYAVSDNAEDQLLRGMQVILQWNPAHLALLGLANDGPYEWLMSNFYDDSLADGLNNTFDDGNAYYQAAGNFSNVAWATPAGLLVTTFRFHAQTETPASEIAIVRTLGGRTTTQVFGEAPAKDVAGSLGSTTITIYSAVDWGRLSLESPDGNCGVQPSGSVTVLLEVSGLHEAINAVQALIEFDHNRLSYRGTTPGDGSGSPWDSAFEVHNEVDAGRITYALGLPGAGSDQAAVVARIEFDVLFEDPPEVAQVRLLPQIPPLVAKLTLASNGSTVIPELGAAVTLFSPGDADADSDIDLLNYAAFGSCLSGPDAAEWSPDCCAFDFDRDGDVDLGDYAGFQHVFTGG